MKAEQFNEIFAEVFRKSSDVLVKKAGEYADDTDRLHNFNVAAHLRGQTPRQALAGFMLKHTVSIYDLVDVQGCPSLDIWDEKIVDHINYLILLRAVVVEELERNGQDTPNE